MLTARKGSSVFFSHNMLIVPFGFWLKNYFFIIYYFMLFYTKIITIITVISLITIITICSGLRWKGKWRLTVYQLNNSIYCIRRVLAFIFSYNSLSIFHVLGVCQLFEKGQWKRVLVWFLNKIGLDCVHLYYWFILYEYKYRSVFYLGYGIILSWLSSAFNLV